MGMILSAVLCLLPISNPKPLQMRMAAAQGVPQCQVYFSVFSSLEWRVSYFCKRLMLHHSTFLLTAGMAR